MKTLCIIIFILSDAKLNCLVADGLTLPAGSAGIEASLNAPPVPELSAEERADPPHGEIRKLYLREIHQIRGRLGTELSTAPAGADGLDSPWLGKFMLWKEGLDRLAESRLQSDVFALIPMMSDAFGARGTEAMPEFFDRLAEQMESFSSTVVAAMAQHIADQRGNVTADNLNRFVTVFSVAGFYAETDWEDEVVPIDAAGVFILDPAAVVAHLKASPPEQAARFLGGLTHAEAFERYSAEGNGLPVLKAKFAADRANLVSKWNELANWLTQQREANP